VSIWSGFEHRPAGCKEVDCGCVEDHGLNLADVVSVDVRPGVLTKIVDVRTNDDLLRFRCFGAPAAAETVRRAAEQARGPSAP
jgi:hypothetical protein